MKLSIISDLHYEHSPVINFYPSPADVLIMAGDITSSTKQLNELFCAIRCDYKEIIYIAGNHEFYEFNKSMQETIDEIQEVCSRHYVKFLNNSCTTIEGVKFVGTTLWSQISEATLSRLKDKWIGLSAPEFRELNNKAVEFLTQEVTKDSVVITHHIPSFSLVTDRYKGDALNDGFACEVPSEVLLKPKVWVFGHTHDKVDEQIRNTRFICNPRGYVATRNYKAEVINV